MYISQIRIGSCLWDLLHRFSALHRTAYHTGSLYFTGQHIIHVLCTSQDCISYRFSVLHRTAYHTCSLHLTGLHIIQVLCTSQDSMSYRFSALHRTACHTGSLYFIGHVIQVLCTSQDSMSYRFSALHKTRHTGSLHVTRLVIQVLCTSQDSMSSRAENKSEEDYVNTSTVSRAECRQRLSKQCVTEQHPSPSPPPCPLTQADFTNRPHGRSPGHVTPGAVINLHQQCTRTHHRPPGKCNGEHGAKPR